MDLIIALLNNHKTLDARNLATPVCIILHIVDQLIITTTTAIVGATHKYFSELPIHLWRYVLSLYLSSLGVGFVGK